MPQRAKAALAVAGHELSALADNLPNPAWIAYPDGAIFWYNRAWYDYTGRSPEEMLGWGWTSVHHPDELVRVTAEWVGALASGAMVEMTYKLRRHDGEFRPFLSRVVPIRGASGEIIRWFGTNVDIGAQVDTEERLRVVEDDWRNLFDEMREAFVVLEFEFNAAGKPVDAVVVKANLQFEAHTGIPNDQAIGTHIVTGSSVDSVLRLGLYAAVVATGISRTFEAYIQELGRTLEMSAYRHSPTQCAILFTDISARKTAEREARQAQERLLRVSRLSAMGAMASTLAHELNQPIGAASNFIAAANEHLQRAPDTDQALLRSLFDQAIASCQRAGQIIRSMRDFTATGQVAGKPEPPCELIAASIAEFEGGAAHREISFSLSCPADLPPILCDRTQIQQVLVNLYTNAAQAVAGSAPQMITVSAAAGTSEVTIRIEDNGPGFTNRPPEQLFEPFWSTTDVGLGLGLPLCRTIVEAHGGTIRAESAPAGGGCFVIKLPIAGAD
ncbi:MAG: PAS domain-containing sensor histidine kinase [Sphingomicrobium sp.]